MQSAAYLYGNGALATHWFGRFSDARTRACLGRLARRAVIANARSAGVSVGPVTTHRLSIAPVGSQRAADRLAIRLSRGGFTINADLDVVYVRVDRGIAVFAFGQVGAPFDGKLEARLVRTVAGRLAGGLRSAP